MFTIGEVNRAYEAARFLFTVQLNSSDDNPGVAVDVTAKSDRYQEMKSYVTTSNGSGAVLPSANFEPLPWVIAFEQLGIAMAHNSITSALRTTKLGTPDFTGGLERYLGTPKTLPRLRRHGEAARHPGHGEQGPQHAGLL